MSRTFQLTALVGGALLVVLLAGLLALVELTLRGVDDDTDRLPGLLTQQVQVTQTTLDTIEAQLAVLQQTQAEAVETRTTAQALLDVAQQTLDTARGTLQTAQATRTDVQAVQADTSQAVRTAQQTLARVEQLLRVARQVEDDVHEINQRTGGAAQP